MKLEDAIRADDADAVRKSLRRVKNVNRAKVADGYAALMWAARHGKANAVAALLAAGADPHHEAMPSMSALGKAAEGDHADVVRLLLGSATWSAAELEAAAGSAAGQKSLAALDALRAAGAKLDWALELAIKHGLGDVVRWCLAAGADARARARTGEPDGPNDTADPEGGGTLLHIAAGFGSATTVGPLVAGGADLDARDRRGRTALMIAAKEEPRIISEAPAERRKWDDAEREGRIIWAVARRDVTDLTVLDELLDAGADAALVDVDGGDALRALRQEYRGWLGDAPTQDLGLDMTDEADREFAEYASRVAGIARRFEQRLLAAGATGGNPADDALIRAVRANDPAGVRAALAAGASPAARDASRYDAPTGLTIAAEQGFAAVARALIDAGADVNDGGRTMRPVARAAQQGQLDMVRLLVAAGADVNLPEPGSGSASDPPWNAMSYAKFNDHPEVAAYLRTVGGRLPDLPVEPFAPGFEAPNTFVEVLVKAPVPAVAAAVATLAARGRGAVDPDALGKMLRAGRQSYAVVRLDGSSWTSVLGVTGTGPIDDDAWRDVARAASAQCAARAILVCYEDTSAAYGYTTFDRGEQVERYEQGDADLYDEVAEHAAEEGEEPPPATLGTGTFESAAGRTLTEDQMQDGAGVLDAVAAAEGFRTLNYGPRATAGAPFEFELPDQPVAVAEAAYVVVR